MADELVKTIGRPKRLASIRRFQSTQACFAKQEIRRKLRKVSNILKKKEAERTEDEISTLHQLPDIVRTAEKNAKRQLQQKERVLEIEDDPEVLDQKCREFAHMLQSAEYAIVYTGAGISTAASIPDYRGPNGVWTLLKKGHSLSAQDLVDAEPTYTHMCITRLFKAGMVKYLVSQNCDGLHVRSGFPRHSLSEIHGNMFIEVCKNCKPQKEYLRLFDVTERTAKCRHKTGRTCNKCGGSLCDSIVHFGEKGSLRSPYKWRQAAKAVNKSDLIICLGSSLKVLRRYPCLWKMDIRPEHRPKLVIVNLQWTPKDERASLKIHGRCDDVLRRLASLLSVTVPQYHRETDPLFRLHTPVLIQEESVASKKSLNRSNIRLNQQDKLKKKISHEPPNVSVYQQPTLYKTECQQKNVPISPTGKFASENASKTDGRFCDGFCKASFHSENRGIPDSVRLKLEQMLKERGVINNASTTTSDGRERPVSVHDSAFNSPPSCIKDILLENGTDSTLCNSYPHLRNLLSTNPSHSQEKTVKQEHDVFRVDLSTNPIKITSIHCPSIGGSNESVGKVPSNLYTDVGMSSSTSSSASSTDYAKMLCRINFDHSYCKNPHKSSSSGKMQKTANLLGCSDNPATSQTSSSHSISVPSVISICPDSSNFGVVYSDGNFRLNNQKILPASESVIGNVSVSLNCQTGKSDQQHSLPYLGNTDKTVTQDKVVVNLNSVAGFAPQPSLHHSHIPPMQRCQDTGFDFTNEKAFASCNLNEHTINITHIEYTHDSQVGSKSESSETKKNGSIPGWFGKGLRVKKKRTL